MERIDHHGIAEALRQRIRRGDLAPGDRMPTQAVLAEEFNAERGLVRRALVLLKEEGLLTGVTSGAPPRIAEQRAPGRSDLGAAAPTSLGKHLTAAFEAPHITVEAFTLTGESLDAHLRLCVERFRTGDVPPPRSVTVRILLPVIADSLPLLRAVRDPQDARPRQRLADIARRHHASMQATVSALRHEGLTESVSFEVRQAPIAPLQKFYLLNNSEAVSGHYEVVRRRIEFDEEPDGTPEVHDLLGLGLTLFHHTTGSAFVEKARAWFAYHWSSSTDTVPFETTA